MSLQEDATRLCFVHTVFDAVGRVTPERTDARATRADEIHALPDASASPLPAALRCRFRLPDLPIYEQAARRGTCSLRLTHVSLCAVLYVAGFVTPEQSAHEQNGHARHMLFTTHARFASCGIGRDKFVISECADARAARLGEAHALHDASTSRFVQRFRLK